MIRFDRPLGFLVAVAALGLLAAHLARRRPRRIVVPFLALWSAGLGREGAGFGGRLVRLLDLFCLLLAILAIAGAAGGPHVPGRDGTLRDLVLVLDGGLELGAAGREEAMRAIAEEEIRRRAPGTRYVVVRVEDGGSPVLATSDRGEALSFARAQRAGWTRAGRDAALAIARGSRSALRDPDLVLLSHRPGPRTGFRLRAVAGRAEAGGRVRNAGFDAVDLFDDPEGGGRVARLRLRGEGRVSVEGLFEGEVRGSREIDAPVAPGRRSFRATSEGDAFPADDELFLFVEERARPSLLVVTEGEPSPFLVAALDALAEARRIRGPADRTTPDRAAEAAPSYDLLLFHRASPPREIPGMRAIYLAPVPGALPFRLGEEADAPAFFDVDGSDPLLSGVDLLRLPPRRGRAILGGKPLASSGAGPLVACGPTWVALGFDPDRSVLAASPSWPILLRNSIDRLDPRRAPRVPEYVAIGERIGGAAEPVSGPPGFRGEGDRTIAVNLLEPELDLRPPGEPSDPLPSPGAPATGAVRLEPHLAASGLLLLLVSWWLYWRLFSRSRTISS